MKKELKVGILILGIFALIVTVQAGIFYQKNIQTNEDSINTEGTKPSIRNGNEPGWSLYTNTDWGLEMEFPSDWKVTEQRVTEEINKGLQPPRTLGELMDFRINNDDYLIVGDRDRGGFGLPMNKTYERYQSVIGGYKANIIEDNSGSGFSQFVEIDFGGHEYLFRVSSKTEESKEITNKILNSLMIK